MGSFLLLSEWLITRLVEPNDPFTKHVDHYFRSDGRNAVFGDSIAAHGFIGHAEFPNFAYPQESPMQMLVKAQGKYSGRNPQHVIVEASITLLFRRDSGAKHYPHTFLRAATPLFKIVSAYHRERMPRYWRVLLSGKGFEGTYRYHPFGGLEWRDWTKARQAALETQEAAVATAVSQITSVKRQSVPANKANYEALIDYLRQRGARICIVEWPVHPAFSEATADMQTYSESRKYFFELAKRNGVAYRSYWDGIKNDASFADHTHLTFGAAKRFSAQIVRECFLDKP